ncbi:23S rRNA pseudouridine2605 synthase [Actinobaculum suis]|uniref:Pseudouridine synthase n=1 Tax=Actinobaculum suis TaxID=1657 RepID=A0A0K9EV43_9ACTO|nr:pseudouridine synthase [Actinobaculum suis]KMY23761.1 MFS transporter [Actinobaculum suis]MDY5153096.1 pseudouridine synthase [Actinobaculum suis]SDE32204.1 23S rRNA pseudouridine2605 synthase [Actinobaculum suis]VDG76480.1 ribosomal large subunit pseudouridine synthase B [Actinobaculum suis]
MRERLQKVMANAGVASRRHSEAMIEQGRVAVNGEIVTRLGTKVDPDKDVIHVDGMPVPTRQDDITIALYKPPGVVSTMEDEMGRPSLAQYVEDRPERLYHVGRLDEDTEGIILLSNNGELTHRLTHPSYEVPKTYVARVSGQVTRGLGRVLENGITLKDGPASVDKFILRESQPRNSIVELTLHEGRNRLVRRMMGEVGHPVLELVRIQFGNIKAGRLRPGQYRIIGGSELSTLMHMVGM